MSPMERLFSIGGLHVYWAGTGFTKPGVHVWLPWPLARALLSPVTIAGHLRVLPVRKAWL